MKSNRVIFALAMAILLGGCGGISQSTMTLVPISQLPIATWTPVSAAEREQNPEILEPLSLKADLGQAYPFRLLTHCGADYRVDFDGSFWQLSNPSEVPVALSDPFQDGTITLINSDYARFDFEGGSLLFIRYEGPKYVPGCA